MKPITAWIRGEAIDELMARYGEYLQRFQPELRRELIAFLAVPDEWDWSPLVGGLSHPLDEIYPLVENLNRHEKDKLIEAIAASLVHTGNPWLRIGNVVEQEKSTPDPNDAA